MNLRHRRVFHAHDKGGVFVAFKQKAPSLEEARGIALKARRNGRLDELLAHMPQSQKEILRILSDEVMLRVPCPRNGALNAVKIKLMRWENGEPIKQNGKKKGVRSPRMGTVVSDLCSALSDVAKRKAFLTTLPSEEKKVVSRRLIYPTERLEDTARVLGITASYVALLSRRALMRLGSYRPKTGFEEATNEELKAKLKTNGVKAAARENPGLSEEIWYRENILGLKIVTEESKICQVKSRKNNFEELQAVARNLVDESGLDHVLGKLNPPEQLLLQGWLLAGELIPLRSFCRLHNGLSVTSKYSLEGKLWKMHFQSS
jgi:hypothetical protein